MDNNFDSILDMYLFEENTLLEQLDEILLKAEEEQAFDKECIDEIFRIMHTIKGSSAMMNFRSIMEISHKVEDLFYYIRENGINKKYNEELVNLVFKFTDFIKGEIVKIENGEQLLEELQPFEQEILEFLQLICNESEIIENSEITEASEEAALTNENYTETKNSTLKYEININFDDDCGMENLRAFFIVNSLQELGIEFSYKPDEVENDSSKSSEIIKNGFSVYFYDLSSLEDGERVVKQALNVKNYTMKEIDECNNQSSENKEKLIFSEPEQKHEVLNKNIHNQDEKLVQPTKNKTGNQETSSKHNKQNLITVNLSKLDNLVDIVGEIVIAESMVTSNSEIKKLNLESFTKSSRQLRKLTDELQDIVMSLRMVPVSGIFQKMKRIVRDMGKELNKEVELILLGEETEVDKTIIDGISDPIMHLVRNAMDHGIETTEERLNKGKNSKGTIILSAANSNGEIHITVEDDGKGFDTEKILSKAKLKGLLKKPEIEYTTKEIYQLLMLPGFSTNDQVTEYSGRGVGMDVVKSNVEKVGGSVVLESKIHMGTAITFQIPLTLAIVSGMQVVVGDSEYIIPIKNIQQSFKAELKDVVISTDGSEMIILRDICYPVVRLHQFYNLHTEINKLEDGILILVESGSNAVCLFVDKIVGEQQVVVKPLPSIFSKYKIKESGISGCSILGDGSINLILDVKNLIESM
ncbi:MAG: cheA 2 [Bacillota bacterium]|jgi:two-component system chemotaxis sensor kinase CheA|nr:cheA 2 [Bacillota bacterium]